MIRFEHVDFAYDVNPNQKILSDFSLEIAAGECVLLTGGSGCGKSTLLRLLNGLIPEFYGGTLGGRITVMGKDISEHGMYDLVGRIGTVFQNPRAQFFNVDTTSELAFGCENLAMPEAEILSRIKMTVADFHIEKLMNRDIFKLSGGEKQKIACASVDVLRPDIILLDEPSANMDYESTQNLHDLIQIWKAEGKTILIAEHRISYVRDIADRVVILDRGMVKHCIRKSEKNTFTDEMCRKYCLRSFNNISPVEMISKENRAVNPSERNSVERNPSERKLSKAKYYGKNEKNRKQLELTDFKYSYGNRQIFDIDSMNILQNSITAIVGENGTGKTTFLECLCGVRKNKGKLRFDGKEFDSKARLKEIFMVMQDPNHQLFTESVLEEILISMPDEDEDRAREILKEMDLSELEERHPMSLSGGQKQRVALACAIASDRKILLLDEPTSGLDFTHMLEVAKMLEKIRRLGRTIIIVTHDSEFIEVCCDEVIRLEEHSKILKADRFIN